MPWRRERYPSNWGEMARECKEKARWQCEGCKVLHGAMRMSIKGEMYRVVLAAAHLDHDPENPSPRLAALCQRCHLRYDTYRHTLRARRRHYRRQRAAMLAAGQLELF